VLGSTVKCLKLLKVGMQSLQCLQLPVTVNTTDYRKVTTVRDIW
jgi:hypothetical protein